MNFTHHNFLGDIELEKKETPGCRLYQLPDGSWVPSITSVTSFYNRDIFIKWRKRIGIEEANKITMSESHKPSSNFASRYSLHKPDLTMSSTPNSIMFNDGMTLRILMKS